MKTDLFISAGNCLGEGPVWDHKRNELLWVDIECQLLCFCNTDTGDITVLEMDSMIGAAVPVDEQSKYLVALQSGIKLFDRATGKYQTLADPESHLPMNRYNDGKCDPAGRFWIGSMSVDLKMGAGSLYCIGSDNQALKKKSNITISNGIAWSSDHSLMYYIDTPTQKIRIFNYDINTGDITHANAEILIPKSYGAPDGMTIDENGNLWVALWGGFAVGCWDSKSGKLLRKIEIPVPNITSCVFGGKNLDKLFITTARSGLSEIELEKYPSSGDVFIADVGVKGIKTSFFNC